MGKPPVETERVTAGIAQLIEGPPGYDAEAWLPPQDTLAEMFETSRVTVKRALGNLEGRGIVKIYKDKGAKVATRHDVIVITAADILEGAGDWRGFPASVYRAGGNPFNDITGTGEVPAPAEVATRLGVPPGTVVFERARVQGEIEAGHRVPIQLSWSWFTMELVNRVPVIRATPASGPSPIRDRVAEAGYLARYEGRAKARRAGQTERALLGLAPDPAIVFEIWRTCFDQEGRPVEVSRLVDDAEKVELAYSYAPAAA